MEPIEHLENAREKSEAMYRQNDSISKAALVRMYRQQWRNIIEVWMLAVPTDSPRAVRSSKDLPKLRRKWERARLAPPARRQLLVLYAQLEMLQVLLAKLPGGEINWRELDERFDTTLWYGVADHFGLGRWR